MRRWRWRRAPALQRRKAAQEAGEPRSAGRSEAGRALAKALPVGSGGPCSLATSVGHGAQLSTVFAPVSHGRRTGVVAPYGDERAATDYAAASGNGDPPIRATGARICPVNPCHVLTPPRRLRIR